ncbi:hypothetical protein PC129_g16280 [Phytophthora cactorum]|uniref:Tf2-1-like SH3-like domain-containing protein n=2 Tax=Phytophthora cactorum TaxID=29920 RepID=A0A8T1CK80_9STRA|nr:hypothetical protein PC111_g21068 [Phytophthora cactorum]KAG2830611.1 hypothetical protein PC112_g7621 [Phytophthora cactorum]KAG2858482.1 hypothetical protein PC113_g9778 [Phytophthora cactorum]KAG2899478.1 hypothetical protein PC117_g22212 [Phytophthora cactorum]KAG2906275.1 hypothetical protein PC114_g11211 [Phytophthora cactorum]
MAESQDLQKKYADAQDRGNAERFEAGDLVLLNDKNQPTHAVSAVFKTKLRPRFIGPFKVVANKGLAYALNLPKKMRTQPVFYVGLLKPCRDPAQVSVEALAAGRQVAVEPQAAGRQRVAEPQERSVCNPVRTRLRKLSNLPLQTHNPVVKRLKGLDPVHPQLHFIEIYRLAVNVVVRVADTRVDRAKSYSSGNKAL